MASTVSERAPSAVLLDNDRGGKYLAFELGREEFAIRVLKVREIMGIQDITAVPHTPAHVKGVINLRGKVIPVIDLRLKFGLPEQEYTQRTCIIVVQVQREAAPALMGIMVDAVAEVLNLAGTDIEDTPDFGDGTRDALSAGHGQSEGQGEDPAGDRPGVDQPGSARLGGRVAVIEITEANGEPKK